MLTKQVQFFGQQNGVVQAQGLFSGALEKTAGVAPFSDWATGDQLRRYIATITPEDRKKYCYVLVNALGAGEYFGSNINADFFPWNALTHEGEDYGYKTFLKAHAYAHHVNKDPTRAFGVPVLSVLNHPMKRVELIIRLDRAKAKQEGQDGIITRVDAGEFPDVSMGCKVPYDVCSICQNRSKTRADYCEHMQPPPEKRGFYGPNKILPDGRKIYVLNTLPRFFDISFVFIGADKTAKVMAKLASKGQQVCLGDICTLPRPSVEVAELVDGEKVAEDRKDLSVGELASVLAFDGVAIPAIGKALEQRRLPSNRFYVAAPLATAIGSLGVEAKRKMKGEQSLLFSGHHYGKKKTAEIDPKELALGEKTEKKEHRKSVEKVFREIAKDHLKEHPHFYTDEQKKEKTASACCTSCAETGSCCSGDDFDKLASAFGVKKLAAKRKLSEIIKSVPASPFALKSLPDLERFEPEMSPDCLDDLADLPLADTLGGTARMGMLLRPREFQRIVLVRMGHSPLADELDRGRMSFREVPQFDGRTSLGDDILPAVLRAVMGVIRDRTAFGDPFTTRVIRIRMGQKPLPTDTPVADPLLDKISAAYNGYRQGVLCKMASAAEEMASNPRLREIVLGHGVSSVFSKTASQENLLSPDSIAYLAGAYLNNRGLLYTPVVAVSTDEVEVGE